MAWLWRNTYLAAAIAAVVAILLLVMGEHSYASFAFMLLGTLLMMRCEVERGET